MIDTFDVDDDDYSCVETTGGGVFREKKGFPLEPPNSPLGSGWLKMKLVAIKRDEMGVELKVERSCWVVLMTTTIIFNKGMKEGASFEDFVWFVGFLFMKKRIFEFVVIGDR